MTIASKIEIQLFKNFCIIPFWTEKTKKPPNVQTELNILNFQHI